jgi:hypothetical protein
METPKDLAERKKLEVEAAKLVVETKKADAEAEKAVREALVPPAPTISGGVEGKTTDEDKDGMLGRMVAYRLLDDAAAKIAASVPKPLDPARKPRVLVVEDRALIEADWPYRVVDKQLESEEDAVAKALKRVGELAALAPAPAPPPAAAAEPAVPPVVGVNEPAIAPAIALGVASTALTTASSLIGLFRTDYTISGGEAKIGATPLLAATAKALRAKGCRVVVDGFELLEGKLVDRFWEAREKRLQLEEEIAAKRVQYGPAVLAADVKAPVGSEAGRATLAAAEVTTKAFDDFTKAVVTPGEKGPPLLVTAARRERLHLEPTDPRAVSHVVYVAVEGGGQEAISKHGALGSNRRMSFLGGAEVSFLLHDVEQNSTIDAGSFQLVGQVEFDLAETSVRSIGRIAIEPSDRG